MGTVQKLSNNIFQQTVRHVPGAEVAFMTSEYVTLCVTLADGDACGGEPAVCDHKGIANIPSRFFWSYFGLLVLPIFNLLR